ncbi:MAG TPA: (2Fe-2S) ferredoxin domain-containing protein [Chitinophagaceae bacterium]|nr:(2Fe-2S) ferredoxin domain-containing protein [Chitinophagaceae bacterium]
MAIKDLTKIRKHLFLCNGGSCKLLGAEESTAAIREAIAACNLSEEIHTTKTLCNGRCKDGPVVISQPDGIWFNKMVKEKAEEFVWEYFVEQHIPEDKVLFEYGDDLIRNS